VIFVKSLLITGKRGIVLILLATICVTTARAQDAKLQIDHLNKLAEKAAEVVEVTLDERLLKAAARFLAIDNPAEAKVKEIISGLKGVYVRVFEFEKTGEYSQRSSTPSRWSLQSSTSSARSTWKKSASSKASSASPNSIWRKKSRGKNGGGRKGGSVIVGQFAKLSHTRNCKPVYVFRNPLSWSRMRV
jgi:hypothetical protein